MSSDSIEDEEVVDGPAVGGGTRPGAIGSQFADALGDAAAGGSTPPYLRDMGRFEGTEMKNPAGQPRVRRMDKASGQRGDPREVSLKGFVLRARTLAALRRAGITTVGEARSVSEQDLPGVTNVGPKSVADLRRALAERSLGPDDPLSCLALPRPLSDRDEAMVHMHASGAGLTAIARHFGISRTRVKQIIDRAEQSLD